MLPAHTLSNGNNCLTSFLFNAVILWLRGTAFAPGLPFTAVASLGDGVLGHTAALAVVSAREQGQEVTLGGTL